MIYSLLRAVAGIALRWYYSDVTVTDLSVDPGGRRELGAGPLLVVVNHPNSLVDVLAVSRAVPRRLMFTAKATLFSNPVAGALLSRLGVLPLRRTSDESGTADPGRNADVFDAVARALARGRAILIFPEGKSHDEPALAPLRTGAARMALSARDSASVRGLRILPIGLIFERKEALRSRLLTVIGESLDMDSWQPRASANAVAELTAEIDARLRAVTLNYDTTTAAADDARLSGQIAAIVRYEAPSVGAAGDLRDRAAIARLLPRIRAVVASGAPETASRAERFQMEIAEFQRSLDANGIFLDDLAISRGLKEGTIFVVREALVLATAGPLAIWGWLNHLLPFQAAIAAGRRARQSAADPAMRTIVAGTALVSMVYMVQGAVVALVFGPWWALAYVVSLPIAADINLRLRERLGRSRRRAKTYLLFRTHPELQQKLEATAQGLRGDALALGGLVSQ